MTETKTVYVVVEGRYDGGDIHGALVTTEKVWWGHLSSDIEWLKRDLTLGFAHRRQALEEAFPGGVDVVVVDVDDVIPDEIAHHIRPKSLTEPELFAGYGVPDDERRGT